MDKQRQREKAARKTFTDLGIKRLRPPKVGQDVIWDEAQKGLSLLVSSGATKTFRATFKLNGQWQSCAIGRFGEMDANGNPKQENLQIGKAREITANYRAKAKEGIDPRVQQQEQSAADKQTYGAVVDRFIKEYAKPRQRTWDQTERILKKNVPAKWLKRSINEITKKDARDLQKGLVADGHGYKAAVTHAWLKKLWRWAYEEDIVTAPIMEAVRKPDFEATVRDRVYTDKEIAAIWTAADGLTPVEGAFFKLLILLAPRKTALAYMRYSDLDDADNPTLWTTPFELTKSRKSLSADKRRKRKYLTPLPPLAAHIIKGLERQEGSDLVFADLPGLYVSTATNGKNFSGTKLLRKLVRHGAPKDFYPHGVRHTVATWLENQGASEWERGLVLNHSGASVTAGYSHGHPRDLKRELLGKWAAHVEGLVQPPPVVVADRKVVALRA
jgi:integrase